jgi:hypothetical protein
MRKIALWSTLAIAAIAGSLIAADHLDAPNVRNMNTDIADFFAFEGENSSSTTFIVSIPAGSAASNFDENVMIEINIDNTGADVPGTFPASVGVSEDLVIQALRQGDKMYFFGPYAPNSTSLNSTIDTNEAIGSVTIGSPGELLNGGVRAFAGQRQDAFYFDFQQFNTVIGTAPAAGFGTTGSNAFAAANVNAIVLEVPNSLLGTAPTHLADQFRAGLGAPVYGLPNSYNVWVETKRRN